MNVKNRSCRYPSRQPFDYYPGILRAKTSAENIAHRRETETEMGAGGSRWGGGGGGKEGGGVLETTVKYYRVFYIRHTAVGK